MIAEIRARSPGSRSLTQAQPLTAEQIQEEVLEGETLLLHYKLGSRRSYLFAVTPRSIESFVLPAREVLEGLAAQVYELLANGARGTRRCRRS